MNDRYPLQPFRIRNSGTLCDVMHAYPLASLVSGVAGSARQTLVPMLVDHTVGKRIVLTGHIDRNNDHVPFLQQGAPVSFQFLGPDSYASPDLYPDSHLPGWLYVSVQGDGEICEVLDESQLRALLIRSTETFGAPGQKFMLQNSDPRIAQFLPYTHGFRIAVTRISGIAKLAQDKGPVDSRIAMDFLAGQNNTGSKRLFERLIKETAGIDS